MFNRRGVFTVVAFLMLTAAVWAGDFSAEIKADKTKEPISDYIYGLRQVAVKRAERKNHFLKACFRVRCKSGGKIIAETAHFQGDAFGHFFIAETGGAHAGGHFPQKWQIGLKFFRYMAEIKN